MAPLAPLAPLAAAAPAATSARGVRWTREEDELLLKLKDVYGVKWTCMAIIMDETLPGVQTRTSAMLRNRVARIETKKMGKNRCYVCGELRRGHVCRGDAMNPIYGKCRKRRSPVI